MPARCYWGSYLMIVVTIPEQKKLIKEQNAHIKKIKAHMEDPGRTVPEIAAATGLDPDKVLYYISALKKYGIALEGEKAGDYFRYKLA